MSIPPRTHIKKDATLMASFSSRKRQRPSTSDDSDDGRSTVSMSQSDVNISSPASSTPPPSSSFAFSSSSSSPEQEQTTSGSDTRITDGSGGSSDDDELLRSFAKLSSSSSSSSSSDGSGGEEHDRLSEGSGGGNSRPHSRNGSSTSATSTASRSTGSEETSEGQDRSSEGSGGESRTHSPISSTTKSISDKSTTIFTTTKSTTKSAVAVAATAATTTIATTAATTTIATTAATTTTIAFAAAAENEKKERSNTAGLRLIFLDIDGVILPDTDYEHALRTPFPDTCMAALCHILYETNAMLVLSSTWRCSDILQNRILCEFQRYATSHSNVAGTSALRSIQHFQYVTSSTQHSRQWEVVSFLQTAPVQDVASWVALDDDTSFVTDKRYRNACRGHYVQIQPEIGLTMDDARRAVRCLLDTPAIVPSHVDPNDTDDVQRWR